MIIWCQMGAPIRHRGFTQRFSFYTHARCLRYGLACSCSLLWTIQGLSKAAAVFQPLICCRTNNRNLNSWPPDPSLRVPSGSSHITLIFAASVRICSLPCPQSPQTHPNGSSSTHELKARQERSFPAHSLLNHLHPSPWPRHKFPSDALSKFSLTRNGDSLARARCSLLGVCSYCRAVAGSKYIPVRRTSVAIHRTLPSDIDTSSTGS